MQSGRHGAITSAPEVTHVSSRGLWLLVDERERFLPYAKFPWFRDAVLREVLEVEREGEDHLRWPALDVDLSIRSIDDPESFPLVSRRPARRRADTGRRRGK